MRIVGLTGGIGSGKSTVAALWRAAGVRVIDLDVYSRRVLDADPEGISEALSRFGDEYRAEDGSVDRRRLSDLVFGDAAARADLEAIVHRRVYAAVAAEEHEARAAGETLVVHDNPLLLEQNRDRAGIYDLVACVVTDREVRLDRLVQSRGRDRAYFERVMSSQVTDDERRRRADLIIANDGEPADLERAAGEALAEIRSRLS